jgi:NTE family protein
MAFALCPLVGICAVAHAGQAAPDAAPPAVSTPACGVRNAEDPRPRIGVALGGGGARGIAHISVLRAIQAHHIPIDCIAGTSMGSLVGGLYAAGMTVDELEELVVSTDWPGMFNDALERPERSYRRKQDDRDRLATLGVGIRDGRIRISPGLLQGERILALLERSTMPVSAIDDFDELPIPFRAVATDLNTGQAVVLDRGSLAMAMRASMSLPGIFQPVELDGRVLLDGGLANQVPVDVVRAMGADIVIAVDVGTPLMELKGNASLLEVMSQITGMMTVGNTQRQLASLGEHDVLIVPPLGDDVATGDFAKAREALAIGARAAQQAQPRLAALSVSPAAYAEAAQARVDVAAGPPVVEFVRLDNQTDYADALLLTYVNVPVGEPLDIDDVERGLLRAYSLGTLSSITYEVVREDGRTGVLVRARPKPQGPNYVQLGFTLNTDFEEAFDTNLRAALLFSPLSPYGAEGRVTVQIGSEPGLRGEYYHPLDVANRYLLYGRLSYDNPDIQLFDGDGNNYASYDVRLLSAHVQFAREFGNYGVVSVAVEGGRGRADVQTGDPTLPAYEFDQGNLVVGATVDRLDSLFFPRAGYYAALGYTASRDWLGSDDEFDQVDFDITGARSWGKHTLQVGGRYHSTLAGELPVQSLYRLGGRTRLAGFRLNELTGQHYALVYGGYAYELARFLGRSSLLGGTLEYGNAWQERGDMAWDDGILNASLYLGFDSWLGPMLIGYGWREGGQDQLFLEIGRPF